MANVKISELSAATAAASGDDLVIVQSGTTKQIDVDLIRNYDDVLTTTTGVTLDGASHRVFCSSTGGAYSVTLPANASYSGKVYTVFKTDSSANAVTVARAGSDTINGATGYALSGQYDSVTIASNGDGDWHIIASTT